MAHITIHMCLIRGSNAHTHACGCQKASSYLPPLLRLSVSQKRTAHIRLLGSFSPAKRSKLKVGFVFLFNLLFFITFPTGDISGKLLQKAWTFLAQPRKISHASEHISDLLWSKGPLCNTLQPTCCQAAPFPSFYEGTFPPPRPLPGLELGGGGGGNPSQKVYGEGAS